MHLEYGMHIRVGICNLFSCHPQKFIACQRKLLMEKEEKEGDIIT